MTDISATSFFHQAGLADGGGIDFEHEEVDTGGSKRPTKIHLHAVDPGSGDRMGTLTYHVPRRKADKILVEHLGTEDDHRGKGVASQLMDEMQRRHPGTPIDHGDRTDDGKAWWAKYTDGKKVTRGRTIASLTDSFRATASHPRAEVPPEQQEALEHPSFSEHRRRALELAKNPVPGTVVWRGEARSGEPHEALHESGVGMHWTVNPDAVLVPRPADGQRRMLWQGRIEHPEQQTIPRSHPSWGGRTGHSMDHEAEVRFKPGAKVHMEGAYVWHGQGDPQGHPVPRVPERTHPDWKWHPVGQHAEVHNLGHIDYGQFDTPTSDAKMPPPWHGADPHTVLQHEHAAGNHHSAHPGGTYDDIDWDAPGEHVDGHSNAVMTDMALKDGYIEPHSLSHEDASEWLRWHPDRANIEQRHTSKTAARVTAAVQDGDDVPSLLLNPHGHHIKADIGGYTNVEMVPRHEIERYASQPLIPGHTKEVGTHMATSGRMEPLLLHYHPDTSEAYLGEGNHRLAAARTLKMDHLPVRVQRSHYGLPGPGVKTPQPHPAIEAGTHIPHDIKPSDIGLTTVDNPTISEWDKRTELTNYRLLHGSKTAAVKPCPCCNGTGEHYDTGFECYHCDGGLTVPADSEDDVWCDGQLPDGGHGKTASADTLHRGVLVEADPNDLVEAHRHGGMPAVHEHIRSLVTGHGGGGLGTHWSSDPAIAHQFSQGPGFAGDRDSAPHTDIPYQSTMHIPVKMQGRIAPEHHETDPDALDSAMVQGHGWNPLNPDRPHEQETLVRPGSPVHLTGMQASLPAHPDWVHHVNDALENWEHEDWGHTHKVPHAWQEIGGAGHHTASFTTPVPDNAQPYEHEHPWLPRDHFFAPGEKGLDPRLFDENDRMHPEVRQQILSLLHGFWAPRYGDGWQSWARVYLAGSEASHFYGNDDLDILIGVDYDTARRMVPALGSLSNEEISTRLTDELRKGLNDPARRLLVKSDSWETGVVDSRSKNASNSSASTSKTDEASPRSAASSESARRQSAITWANLTYETYLAASPTRARERRVAAAGRQTPRSRDVAVDARRITSAATTSRQSTDSLSSNTSSSLPSTSTAAPSAGEETFSSSSTTTTAAVQECEPAGSAYAGSSARDATRPSRTSERIISTARSVTSNDERLEAAPPGYEWIGPFESTFYVNPDSYDIRDIKPYAAYDITRDEWAVRPVEVPDDFGPEKLPESTWDVFEAVQKLIGAIQELPEGVREREGSALYDYLHTDRHSAFGSEGSGLYDPANAVWKALDKAPDQPLQQLIDWKHAHDGVSAATDQEKAA